MSNIRIVILVLACLLSAVTSNASMTYTLEPVEDINVKYAAAANNGDQIVVKYDTSGLSNTRKGYARYDISNIDVNNVQAVTFKFTLASGDGATIYVYGLKDATPTSGNGRIGDVEWTEADIAGTSHQNAPANEWDGGSYIGAGSPVIADQMYGFYGNYVTPANDYLVRQWVPGGTSAGTVYSLTSSKLIDWIKADSNGTATLMFFPKHKGVYITMASSEHATYDPPQLIIRVRTGMVFYFK